MRLTAKGSEPLRYSALHARTQAPPVAVFGALRRVTRLKRPVFKAADYPTGFSAVIEHVATGLDLSLAIEEEPRGVLLTVSIDSDARPLVVHAGPPGPELLAMARARMHALACEISEALRTKMLPTLWARDAAEVRGGSGTPTPPRCDDDP